MTGGSNVKAELDALAAQAVASYGASMQSWVSTAFTVKTARSVATHGTWAAFLDSAGITARVAQRMIRIAEIGDTKCYGESYLLAVTALGGAVTALGGIEATLEAQAHSPKKVRELVARHARITELAAELDTERSSSWPILRSAMPLWKSRPRTPSTSSGSPSCKPIVESCATRSMAKR